MNDINQIQNNVIDIGRYDQLENESKLSYEIVPVNFGSVIGKDVVEFHLYDLDGNLLKSNHKVLKWKINQKNSKLSGVDLNIKKDILDLTGNINGNYKFIYNFHRNIIGSYINNSGLIIKEISSDKRNVKILVNSEVFEDDLFDLKNNFSIKSDDGLYEELLLNFGNNVYYKILDYYTDEYNDLYVKLDAPAKNISIGDNLWIDIQVRNPYKDAVILDVFEDLSTYNILQPNFTIDVDEEKVSETEYENWNELLSSNIHTSQEILNEYLGNVKLNVDYSKFENFVHFSSATERLKNFKYKLKLIENYNSKIKSITSNTSASSVVADNLISIIENKSKLIRGFDGFENYLYFEPTGSYFTHISREIDTWPKIDSEIESWKVNLESWVSNNDLYKEGTFYEATYSSSISPNLHSVTSSISQNYFNNLLEVASDFDRENVDSLLYTIPRHIREDENNLSYELFVNMIGHHFDILWVYINKLTSIYSREEHPKLGMPDFFIKNVGKSLGWEFAENNGNEKLWNYLINQNENTNNLESKSYKDVSNEIWRRVLNNSIGLLKSKGTSQSIRTLLNSYGVPETILKIKEYGNVIKDKDPIYKIDKFNYETYFSGSYMEFPSVVNGNPWKSVEFRIKPDDIGYSQNKKIFESGNISITYDISGSYLDINFQSASLSTSIDDIKTFDNEYIDILLNYNNSYNNLYAKKSKYGKIVVNRSSSISNPSWNIDNQDSVFGSEYYGYGQEIRLWKDVLTEKYFNDHVTAPLSYNSEDITSSYDNLLSRYRLSYNINYDETSSLDSTHPADNLYQVTASLFNFTSDDLSPFEETNYIKVPIIGGSYPIDEKIDIIDNTLYNNTLDLNKNLEDKKYDVKKYMSNKLIGVYFSPTNIINEDIYTQLGGTNLDNYTGNIYEYYGDSYTLLSKLSKEYHKKYDNPINTNDYIRYVKIFNFSIFSQIKKLIPARSSKLTGIMVEPHLLERNKFKKTSISRNNLVHNTELIVPKNYDFTSIYQGTFTGSLSNVSFIQGLDNSSIQSYDGIMVFNENKYESMSYKYNELIAWRDTTPDSEAAYDPVFLRVTNPYWEYEPLGNIILNQRPSKFIQETEYFYSSSYSSSLNNFYSSSYISSDVEDYDSMPIGLFRIKYGGSKLIGTSINTDTPQTVDGGPVVEVKSSVNNQLLVKEVDASSGSLEIR